MINKVPVCIIKSPETPNINNFHNVDFPCPQSNIKPVIQLTHLTTGCKALTGRVLKQQVSINKIKA